MRRAKLCLAGTRKGEALRQGIGGACFARRAEPCPAGEEGEAQRGIGAPILRGRRREEPCEVRGPTAGGASFFSACGSGVNQAAGAVRTGERRSDG